MTQYFECLRLSGCFDLHYTHLGSVHYKNCASCLQEVYRTFHVCYKRVLKSISLVHNTLSFGTFDASLPLLEWVAILVDIREVGIEGWSLLGPKIYGSTDSTSHSRESGFSWSTTKVEFLKTFCLAVMANNANNYTNIIVSIINRFITNFQKLLWWCNFHQIKASKTTYRFTLFVLVR